jgi:hypothetical protein
MHLGILSVIGYRRVPFPPARIIAWNSISNAQEIYGLSRGGYVQSQQRIPLSQKNDSLTVERFRLSTLEGVLSYFNKRLFKLVRV